MDAGSLEFEDAQQYISRMLKPVTCVLLCVWWNNEDWLFYFYKIKTTIKLIRKIII